MEQTNTVVNDPIGIHIGHNRESMEELGKLILDILKSGQEQETLRCALGVIGRNMSCDNNMLSGCSVFMAPPPKPADEKPDPDDLTDEYPET